MRYGISDNSGLNSVTGRPQMSDVARDAVDQIGDGHWKWLESGGTQSGSHPAKTQSETLRPFGKD